MASRACSVCSSIAQLAAQGGKIPGHRKARWTTLSTILLDLLVALAALLIGIAVLPSGPGGFPSIAWRSSAGEGEAKASRGAQEPDAQATWPTESWRTSSSEEQGMNSGRLGAMVDYIDEQELPVDSVIVIRNGTIVLEESRSG
jgi:hypothetical protein